MASNPHPDESVAIPSWLEQKLDSFKNQRVLNLESYKRNGEPKRTPVIFVERNGKLYFHTAVNAWKAKRVARSPRVRVAPSTFRGEPKGDWLDGTAARVEGEEAKGVRKAFTRRFTIISYFVFFLERLFWGKTAYFSISLDPGRGSQDG
ncbi:MAG: PPOX class F420-dependent oxidoreductase [Nitrososphaerota archaeon]|jgi:hypothetical protein|nr:PPOX class F420-dependent oxidoreductase [Nitrososphaerota archaeon]MDG6969372.1 PPOX class F420-dependent oxidoreductase [Nitrososphaerota archaeon]MDG6972977.1 PPOX class F420-dependent oxidoreductase [Nitrososphaerota archaeon]MDG7015255.1 PPOX class F420-dependent oxidoreductase [Nitrososphaerota archaeon]WGO50011.1 MAG: PPOX class F420-dependent oxidoreductase [Nitrososphaerota archaeon]